MAASRKLRKHSTSMNWCRPSSRLMQGTALASSQSFDHMHKGISEAARLEKPVSWQLVGMQVCSGRRASLQVHARQAQLTLCTTAESGRDWHTDWRGQTSALSKRAKREAVCIAAVSGKD